MMKPKQRLRVTLATVGVIAFALAAGSASATIMTATSPTFQQTQNAPCVIGNTSCKNGGLVDFEASGTPGGMNGSQYDLFSPSYVAGAALAAPDTLPTSFTIGVDENIAAGQAAEILAAFNTYTCTGTVAMGGNISGGGSIPAGCTKDATNSFTGPFTIPNANNGNGFSDFLLTGFQLTSGTKYLFEAIVSNDTDGMEQFFVIPAGTTPVPEPASLALFGTALAGLGLLRRRRRKNV